MSISGQHLYGRNTRPRLRGAEGSQTARDAYALSAERNQLRREQYEKKLILQGCELVICPECGMRRKSLNSHVSKVHKMSWREFRVKHQLSLGTKSCTPELQKVYRRNLVESDRMRVFLDNAHSAVRHDALRQNIKLAVAAIKARPRSDAQAKSIEAAWSVEGVEKRKITVNSRNKLLVFTKERVCHQCGSPYTSKKTARLFFCSADCYHRSKKGVLSSSLAKGHTVIQTRRKERESARMRSCQHCGKDFLPSYQSGGKYCSRACYLATIVSRKRDSLGRLCASA